MTRTRIKEAKLKDFHTRPTISEADWAEKRSNGGQNG